MKNDYDADDEISLDALESDGLRWMSVVVVLLVVAGFFCLAWYAYHTSSRAEGDGADIVKAEAGPVKEKPKDAGGMQTPYQDMSVYNVMSGDTKAEQKETETLLPEPEEPMLNRENVAKTDKARPGEDMKMWLKDEGEVASNEKEAPAHEKLLPPPANKTNVPMPLIQEENAPAQTNRFMENVEQKEASAPSVDQSANAKIAAEANPAKTLLPAESVPPVDSSVAKTPALASSAAAPLEKVAPAIKAASPKKQEPAKEPVKNVATTPAKVTTAQSSGNVQAQIAALKTPAEASATWVALKKKYADLLAGKNYLIVKADLPTGTFYRLRVSGLSAEGAKQLCASLMARKQNCLVVR